MSTDPKVVSMENQILPPSDHECPCPSSEFPRSHQLFHFALCGPSTCTGPRSRGFVELKDKGPLGHAICGLRLFSSPNFFCSKKKFTKFLLHYSFNHISTTSFSNQTPHLTFHCSPPIHPSDPLSACIILPSHIHHIF
jgi:hypothetical protein